MNEYERLYLKEKWDIKDIWRYAKIKKKENIGYNSFLNHMNNHVQAVIDESVKSSKMREDIIQDEVWKTIEISKNLRRNIESLQGMIDKKMETFNVENSDDRNIILQLLREARMLYDLLLKYDEKIDIKEDINIDSIYDKVISCMIEAGIPDEYLYKFNLEWKKRI